MIRHQLVQWILLPGGLTGDGQLRASVFVAPRLHPGGNATLADFPDFADWSSVLNGLTLLVERPDGATEAPLRVTASARGGLWRALLPATTPVKAFTFEDLADRPLISFPVGDVLAYLRNQWATLALAAHDDLPVTNDNASPIGGASTRQGEQRPFTLSRHFSDLIEALKLGGFEGTEEREELSRRLRSVLDGAAEEARALRQRHETLTQDLVRPFGSGTGGPAQALYALAGFHARPQKEKPKGLPADQTAARAQQEQTEDFHQHLSTLGDHPALLRRLGLVLDLEIRPDFVPQSTDSDPPTRLRLRVERPSAFPSRDDDPDADAWNADVTPWTVCRRSEIGGQPFFDAVERTSRGDFAHGFLRMDPDRYRPETVDVDGLALKALNMAATLGRQEDQKQRPVDEPERDGVPTARTGGLAVVHAHHAEELHEDFYQARLNNDALEKDPDNPPVLAYEDLLRGFRMDVLRTGDGWRSLHARHMVYTPLRDPDEEVTVDDEGFVQLSLTAEMDTPQAPADPDRPLYAHESLVTWDGWSLSAPRPGEPVAQEPAPPAAAADLGGLRLSIAAGAPRGALPRLRFRSRYRIRLRTVDLAGRAHELPAADALTQILEAGGDNRYVCAAPSGELPYLRFEPLPPTELVPRRPFTPGEGMERLVVRSTPGQSAAEYAAACQASTGPAHEFRAFCDRHLAAPKASLQLFETHGLLDDTIQAMHGSDPLAAAAAAQSAYDFAVRECAAFHEVPGPPDADRAYVVVDADTVDLPYLPDPLCAGLKARLTLRPDAPEKTLDIPFEQAGAEQDGSHWPRPLPIRLRLEEGDFTTHYSADDRLLTVGLPPGRTARLRLSSLFLDDPDVFALLGWCDDVLGASDAQTVREAIAAGTHWMTTPWRDLVLVHAVQRPVEQPNLLLTDRQGTAVTSLARTQGASAADLEGLMYFDEFSTGRLDLSAKWDETEDDGATRYADVHAMVRHVRNTVFSLTVPEPFGTRWLPEIKPLIGPYDRWMPFRTRGAEGETPETLRARLLSAAAAADLPAAERRRLEAGAAQLETFRAHEFGDTRYRRVTYRFTAATRFREYFDPAMPTTDGSSAAEPFDVILLSSAPPAKPKVRQVLPLMGYAQHRATDGSVVSERTNLGVRVWLERPWFSSGAGEELAVVCGDKLISPLTELSREISCLLHDPTHGSTVPEPLLAPSFGNGRQRGRVRLCASSLEKDVVTFQPTWDPERASWYVDLRFPTGMAYFPFVRLALARYQEHSLPGCELSPIVPTAFLQTVPDRTLTCAVSGDRAHVTLSGPAPESSADEHGDVIARPNTVAAVVEVQDPAFTDPYLGWTAVDGVETLLNGAPAVAGHPVVWEGDVPLPPTGGRRLRIAVREYELHPADDRTASPPVSLTEARRLVHADIVPL
ncbi:hypothetical protein [Streptomyces sp900129855]|uniref:Uncharacterized protein n=1 Tax=Streptomyces sp. 900129855 TaxID=3155129 RepID=A0ABV2ZKP5_9ACTN